MRIKDVKTQQNVNIKIFTRTEKKRSINNYNSASLFPIAHPCYGPEKEIRACNI